VYVTWHNASACGTPYRALEHVRCRGWRSCRRAGKVLRLDYTVDGRRQYAATLPRHVLDQQFVAQAEAWGVTMMSGVTVHEPVLDGSAVTGVRASQSGASITVKAKLTIVADGHRVQLRVGAGRAWASCRSCPC